MQNEEANLRKTLGIGESEVFYADGVEYDIFSVEEGKVLYMCREVGSFGWIFYTNPVDDFLMQIHKGAKNDKGKMPK